MYTHTNTYMHTHVYVYNHSPTKCSINGNIYCDVFMCMHVVHIAALQLITIEDAWALKLEKSEFVSWLTPPFNSCVTILVCVSYSNKCHRPGG